MSELLACQRDMASALIDARDSAPATRWLAGSAALVERRLAIYRANVEAAAAKALAAAYPVIHQVVGGARFDDLARAYLHDSPSRSGDLHELGSTFAEFLAVDASAPSLPYLPDLARLEWAAHRAYGAADAEALDTDALAQLPAHRQPMVRFDWAAGTTLVDSAFPIVRIWRIHQPGFDGEFSVDWSAGEIALVAREGLRVAVHAVSAGVAAFVGASLGGASFGTAAELAWAQEPGLDLAGMLKPLLATHVICGFNDGNDGKDE